jgi:hypothetical protein
MLSLAAPAQAAARDAVGGTVPATLSLTIGANEALRTGNYSKDADFHALRHHSLRP